MKTGLLVATVLFLVLAFAQNVEITRLSNEAKELKEFSRKEARQSEENTRLQIEVDRLSQQAIVRTNEVAEARIKFDEYYKTKVQLEEQVANNQKPQQLGAWLGFGIEEVGEGRQGVKVTSLFGVVGPSKVQVGDVVMSINRIPTPDVATYRAVMDQVKPGSHVLLILQREGETLKELEQAKLWPR